MDGEPGSCFLLERDLYVRKVSVKVPSAELFVDGIPVRLMESPAAYAVTGGVVGG